MGQSTPNPLPKVRKGAHCPICTAPTEAKYNPFCSSRCADVDLSRWLRGAYAIPGAGADADEDGDDTQASQRPATAPHIDEDER
jgi:uncharacterized protein